MVQVDYLPIFDYNAITHPTVGKGGMVGSQREIASEVGADILRKGGNAVDAAVATALALAVVLPRAGNLGGGGFMLVYLSKEKKTVAIDYREMAPSAAHRDLFLDKKGNYDRKKAVFSLLSAGVPGTVAGLAYACIPVTHRDFYTSITFISAYGAGGEKPETIDWTSFSKTSQLIVIYMGLERINWVCSELIKRGRDKNENIAIISNATKQNQKILISTLFNCSKSFDKNAIDSPALLVIGKNVLLSPILNWYSTNKRNISFLKQNKKNYEQYNIV